MRVKYVLEHHSFLLEFNVKHLDCPNSAFQPSSASVPHFHGGRCRRNSRDVCSVDGQGDKQRDCP